MEFSMLFNVHYGSNIRFALQTYVKSFCSQNTPGVSCSWSVYINEKIIFVQFLRICIRNVSKDFIVVFQISSIAGFRRVKKSLTKKFVKNDKKKPKNRKNIKISKKRAKNELGELKKIFFRSS